MKNFGFKSVCISLSSSWQAWPDTCTSANDSYITLVPISISLFITLNTVFSLPGIGDAETTTVSSGTS